MRKHNNLSLPARQTGLLLLIFFFLAFGISSFTMAKGKKDKGNKNKPHIAKTAIDPLNSIMDINNTTMWVTDAGFHDWVVASSWNGAFPKGMSVGAIFAQGIVWGGQVYDGATPTIRVNGNDYGSGTFALTRLFRVRPDYATADLTDDAANYNSEGLGSVTDAQITSLRNQYAKDWQEWPADEGAPYDDVNKDGKYDPAVDIPGIPGASQTLFIMYDDRNSVSLYSSPQIGLQIQETYWAYSYTGALGNVIYDKVDMIYKGTSTSSATSHIDSMYIVQWADPDVGNSGDDFAGCDTSLNLGYAYTSQPTDAVYAGVGLAPPAVGFDFLQGVSQYTGNPADSAIYNLKWRKGYKYVNPKPMSSFIYFAAGGKWDDPDYNYTGTLQYYNLMRGFLPRPPYPSTEGFPESVADVTSSGTYLCDGDPVAGTGKLDGTADTPGDRRIMCVNGPLNVKLGDTLEVVTALIYGLGTDNLSSITALKSNDAAAQKVYDLLFQLPSIAPPTVQVAQLNNKIILNWGSDLNSINKIENFSGLNYNFEGYDIYQLRTASSSITDPNNSVKLATYDLVNGVTNILDSVVNADGVTLPVVVENGKDKGIQRYIQINTDAFTNQPLRNGQTYYFSVVAYAYNPAPLLPFHSLKSPVVVKACIPQMPLGERFNATTGDTLISTHSAGTSDGNIIPIVIDPSATGNGDSYKVTFDTLHGNIVWNLIDVTTGETLAANQTNQSGDENYPIVNGVMIKVVGPSPGLKQVAELDADDKVVDGSVGLIPLSLGSTGYFVDNRAGVANGAFGDRTYDRFLYWGTDDVIIDFTQESLTWDYSSEEVHIDKSTGQPYKAPFAVYRKKFPSGEIVRLFAGFWDTDTNGVWNVDGTNWPDPLTGAPCYEPIYCWQGYDANGNEINYDPANDAQYVTDNALSTSANTTFGGGTGEFVYPYVTATLFCMYRSDATLPIGHKVIFITKKTNSPQDEFTFTAPKVDQSLALTKVDVNKINVFPNPYYGYQNRETSRDNHYVTFSHLPAKATIRIFDLSGVLVKTIRKSDPTQFTTWNLQNDSSYPVSSGIYVAYIDLPDLGTTKILKIAIIQEQQILKVY